jgi:hypothetical protein
VWQHLFRENPLGTRPSSLGKKLRETLNLGFQHLSHYPNKFQQSCSRDFDLGGGFQHTGCYPKFQHGGARDFDRGGGFQGFNTQVNTLSPVQASMAYIHCMVFQHGVPQRSIHTQFTTRTPTPILDAMKARPFTIVYISSGTVAPNHFFPESRCVSEICDPAVNVNTKRGLGRLQLYMYSFRDSFLSLCTSQATRPAEGAWSEGCIWFVEVSSLTSLSFVISLLDNPWVSSLGLPVVNLRTIYVSV